MDTVQKAIGQHFDYLDLQSKIPKNSKVFIKLNLLMKSSPNSAIITHPAIVKGVVRNLKEIGIDDITIGDSPGGPFTVGALKSIYSSAGLISLAEEENVKLNYNIGSKTVDTPTNVDGVRTFDIIDAVLEADFVINICKLKSHGMMTLSCAVKNMFGIIPGLTKPEYHLRYPDTDDFAGMLVDLCQTSPPDVTFVDAVDAMEGDGPSGGTKRHLGMVLSGYSPYNIDRVVCEIIGLDYEKIPTVKSSIGKGLCPKSIDDLEIIGDDITFVTDFKLPKSVRSLLFDDKIPGFLKKPFHYIEDAVFKPKPLIETEKCIGCGKCAESCPAHTITIANKKASINYRNCIKCYCCHEMCPVRAIDFKRSFLTKTRG